MEWLALLLVFVLWWKNSSKFKDLEERIGTLQHDLHVKDNLLQQLTRRVFDLESAPRVAVERPVAPEVFVPVAVAPVAVPVEQHLVEPEPEFGPEPAPALEPEPVQPYVLEPTFAEQFRAKVASRDWEQTIGTSWLNAAGVLVLVIGISLLLGYTLTVMGPVGKVAIGLGVSVLMIAAGVVVERQEKYAVFGRGLIAGGWATLYFTIYAMYALPAAKVIDSPYLAGVAMLLVSCGMIGHSLRYRSQNLTLLAFATAYLALQLAPVSALSIGASIPLTIALLVISRALEWGNIPIAGMLLTYLTFAFRYDSKELSPLMGAASLYTYWICFETYDLLKLRDAARRQLIDATIFPLNIMLMFAVAGMTLPPSTPESASNFLASLGALMLVSTALRMQWKAAEAPADPIERAMSYSYRFGITVMAVFFMSAVLKRFTGIRADIGLLLEGQLIVLAGMRYGDPYIRRVGGAVFLYAVWHLFGHATDDKKWEWAPMALWMSLQFYVNRWLTKADPPYTYVASGLMAIGAAALLPQYWFATVWIAMGLVLIEVYRITNLQEFRYQAAFLGAFGTLSNLTISSTVKPELKNTAIVLDAVGAVLAYAGGLRLSGFDETLRTWTTACGTLLATWAIWLVLPAPLVVMGWGLLGLILLERGVIADSKWVRWQAHALLFASFVRVFFANLPIFTETAGISHRVLTVTPLILLALHAWRRTPDLVVNRAYSYTAALLAVALLRFELGRTVSVLGWSGLMLVLLWFGTRRDIQDLRWQAYMVAALTFARAFATNFYSPDLSIAQRVMLAVAVIASYHAGQFLLTRDHRFRIALSLAGSTLLGLLLFHEISGRMLTIAWGVQAVGTLMAGFMTQERVMRLTGLAVFLLCILKLFFYDLRELDTLGRILSFIVLGLVLMGASWLYMKFRDTIQRYL